MLEITSIKNGIVIDHIEAGKGLNIFNYLELDKNNYSVALIINADSKKLGKKDIVKIENCEKLDYTVLGLLSPTITICEVKDEVIVNKVNTFKVFFLQSKKNIIDILKTRVKLTSTKI